MCFLFTFGIGFSIVCNTKFLAHASPTEAQDNFILFSWVKNHANKRKKDAKNSFIYSFRKMKNAIFLRKFSDIWQMCWPFIIREIFIDKIFADYLKYYDLLQPIYQRGRILKRFWKEVLIVLQWQIFSF